MFENDLVSVIIPVYNVEKYIKRCINSVINQTYKNIEIIIIDDGSTDNSGKIVDEYEKTDGRIRVIHKKNGGLSDARNCGISKANGNFITFVDSDDEISNYYVEILYNLIVKNNAQMSIGAYTIVYKKRKVNLGEKHDDGIFTPEICIKKMLKDDGFTVSASAKMYAKALFDNITYPVGKLFEDNAVTYKLIMKCSKIAYTHESIYYYYNNNQSITNLKFDNRSMDYIEVTDNACNEITYKYPKLKETCEYRKALARFSTLKRIIISKKNDKNTKKYEHKIIEYLSQNHNALIKNVEVTPKIRISLFLLKINYTIFKLGVEIYEKSKF